MIKRPSKFAVLLVLLLLSSWVIRSKRLFSFEGYTMGTSYSVQAFYPLWITRDMAQAYIDEELKKVNASMSTYDPLSEISLFNSSTDLAYRDISKEFYFVISIGKQLYDLSSGAWDGTVDPLIKLWGFDNKKREGFPEHGEVTRIKNNIGFSNLSLREGQLKKDRPSLGVNVSSIAKGYGVDQIRGLLFQLGVKQAFIEIGGEIRVIGARSDGRLWRAGVQHPNVSEALDLYGVVELYDRAMATSGDYRQFFEHEGISYSHIIDPRTGYPVKKRVASVTVLAESCAFADGLATAFMVMKPAESLAVVESLDGVEMCLLLYDVEGAFKEIRSSGFVFGKSHI